MVCRTTMFYDHSNCSFIFVFDCVSAYRLIESLKYLFSNHWFVTRLSFQQMLLVRRGDTTFFPVISYPCCNANHILKFTFPCFHLTLASFFTLLLLVQILFLRKWKLRMH